MDQFFLHTPSGEIPEDATTNILRGSAAIDYHRTLPGYRPTPLLRLPALAQRYGVGEVYVKDESHRFGLNAFKGLGASYAIHALLQEKPDIEVFCTATDGNHGRAVAWAAALAGKRAVVYVPRDTVQRRIAAIEREGATVIATDLDYDGACALAARHSRENGWELVQDTAWEGYETIPALIMAGYLTACVETDAVLSSSSNRWLRGLTQIIFLRFWRKKLFFERAPKINFRRAKIDLWRTFKIRFSAGGSEAASKTTPAAGGRKIPFETASKINTSAGGGKVPFQTTSPPVDVVFLQAGVGSWATACTWYFHHRYGPNRPKIVLVEPAASNGMLRSLQAGKRTLPDGDGHTIMAGLNCGIPSLSAWEILRHGADAALCVEDPWAEHAMREWYYPRGADPRITAGESGAAGFAGFLALITEERFRNLRESLGIGPRNRVLFFNTEGATDPAGFERIVGEGR